MKIPIQQLRYPWEKLGVNDWFAPVPSIAKRTVHALVKLANARYKPKRFSAKTTKNRWEIRRVE